MANAVLELGEERVGELRLRVSGSVARHDRRSGCLRANSGAPSAQLLLRSRHKTFRPICPDGLRLICLIDDRGHIISRLLFMSIEIACWIGLRRACAGWHRSVRRRPGKRALQRREWRPRSRTTPTQLSSHRAASMAQPVRYSPRRLPCLLPFPGHRLRSRIPPSIRLRTPRSPRFSTWVSCPRGRATPGPRNRDP